MFSINQIIIMLWFYVLPILGIAMTALFFIFVAFILPKPAKKLTKAKFKKAIAGIFMVHGKGQTRIHLGYPVSAGLVKLDDGKTYIFHPLRPKSNSQEEQKYDPQQEIISRREIIPEIGVPVWHVYESEVVAVNGETLTAIDAVGREHKVTIPPEAIHTIRNGGQAELKVLLPFNPERIAEALPNWVSPDHLIHPEAAVLDEYRAKHGRDIGAALKFVALIMLPFIAGIIALVMVYNATIGQLQSQAETAKLLLGMLQCLI